ncbi:MAG TPA: hypothetical protein VGO29_09850 [Solirubrobacteraceae bacterium]|nr:hypothetical protein [Solirubrobacteraceae bacterium]
MSLDRKRVLILLGIATLAFTVILELIEPSHGTAILYTLCGVVLLLGARIKSRPRLCH